MRKQPYHDLVVWQVGQKFVLETYHMTEFFPTHERYGIVSQLRRAAVSVLTNLVEGHAKQSTRDCLRFLDIANGSLRECALLIELGYNLKYIHEEEYELLEDLRSRTSYLMNRFISGTRQRL